MAASLAPTALTALPGAAAAGFLERPVDPKQETALAFGERSHWLQPWRGYLDTPPATRLRDAIGHQLQRRATRKLPPRPSCWPTRAPGARLELGWDQMSHDDRPTWTTPAGCASTSAP